MLEELKKEVCEANLELVNQGVVIYTWGNVSGISDNREFVVIKPSGVKYSCMSPEDMVVVSLKTGEVVEGRWRPSTDTATHLELYRSFHDLKGVSHTHSVNAVAFSQAGMGIPILGTTHADYFYGDIPCTRELKKSEVLTAYEKNTGKVIVETVKNNGYNPMDLPGILVRNHGPFSWGSSPSNAVFHAVIVEKIAEMAIKTIQLNPNAKFERYILDKHYSRKNGPSAYYGQIS